MLHCPTCGRQYAAGTVTCPEDGTALRADSTLVADIPVDPLVGRVLDEKYRLDERLGEGGMGTVYRATHLLIDRPVAIKILNPRLVKDEAAQERFRREARAAGRLQHTNAVAVTDFGQTEDNVVYIVMELLKGRSLRQVLAHEAPLDAAVAVALMLQVADAVAAAHEAGIIHRDLKPGNIFIVERSDAPHIVKVLDFGIAKLAVDKTDGMDVGAITEAGVMIGTPRYMSPEQCDGAPLTPASDVYSLGIILYEMLTGETPFTGASPLALAVKHASEPPRRPREIVPTIPPALEDVVLHALEKKTQDRPADAGAFRRELNAVARQLGLEHAAALSVPNAETPQTSGPETPSEHLVIDIEKLRQQQEIVPPSTLGETETQVAAEDEARSSAGTVPASPILAPPRSRLSIPLDERQTWSAWLQKPSVLIGSFVAILVLSIIIGMLVASRSNKPDSASSTNQEEGAVGRVLSSGSPAAQPPVSPPKREPQTAAEFYERGAYYFSLRDYDAAIRDYRRALELQKDFPDAHNRLGWALLLKSRFDEAIAEFRQAIEQRGGNYPAAQYNLGFALQQQGETDKALEAYNGAITNRGGIYPDAYYQIGIILLNLRRDSEAAGAFRKAIEQNSGRDPDAHSALGVALARQEDYTNAEREFRRAIEQRNNNYPEAHYNLGLLYERTNRVTEAIKEYETYLQQSPKAPNRQTVEKSLRELRKNQK